MKRRLRWFGSVVLLAAVAGCGGESGGLEGVPVDPGEPGEAVFAPDEPTELWFVEFEHAPLARGGGSAVLDGERIRFKEGATRLGLRYKQRYSFNRLWNGLSVQVLEGLSDRLAGMPGVKAIYPVVPIQLDDAPVSGGAQTELYTALSMTHADIVHSQLGYTGQKVLVGVIDSGIDINHPDLGGDTDGCFGAGCRVAYGYDFVGDAYDAATAGLTTPAPDDIPDDCGGHGSHVAGIIGANGAVVGVAPDVTYGAYRVFGCAGSTSGDVMIAAMEQAAADGMRVVNMSIGSPFQWPSYPTATAADALSEQGVVVVTSIGNSGATGGLYTAGAPGVGERVIGSASIENTYVSGPGFRITPDARLIGYKRATAAPVAPLDGNAPLLRTSATPIDGDGCVNPPAPGSLTGAVVLIRRGSPVGGPTCGFYAKAKAAQDAGAVGVVLYNNTTGTISPTVAGTPAITIPVVAITQDDGLAILALMNQSPVTHSWTDLAVSTANSLGSRISDFSSYGLTAALTFKPDIAAPGGNIWSTVPLELGGYDSYSGTSMASPHMAGTVALLLEARPDLEPWMVRDILQNNAVPTAWSGDFASGVPEYAFRQGAGLVQIDKAILSTTMITPGKIAVGESAAGPWSGALMIVNRGAGSVTYDLSHVRAKAAGGNHWAPTGSNHMTAVDFGAPSVTVGAGSTASVNVTITADPALADNSLYGGYLVFTPQGGGDVLRVPYAGFKGDYQALPVLTPTASNYPWLAKRSGTTYTNQPNGATFTLQGTDIPYLTVHYDHQAARVTIDAYGAGTMKPYGRVLEMVDFGGNTTATAFTAHAWNGMTTMNKTTALVPNGTYVLKIRVLKALGDESNPAHWETWTSPVITLNHP